jgi:hypothetical protein
MGTLAVGTRRTHILEIVNHNPSNLTIRAIRSSFPGVTARLLSKCNNAPAFEWDAARAKALVSGEAIPAGQTSISNRKVAADDAVRCFQTYEPGTGPDVVDGEIQDFVLKPGDAATMEVEVWVPLRMQLAELLANDTNGLVTHKPPLGESKTTGFMGDLMELALEEPMAEELGTSHLLPLSLFFVAILPLPLPSSSISLTSCPALGSFWPGSTRHDPASLRRLSSKGYFEQSEKSMEEEVSHTV